MKKEIITFNGYNNKTFSGVVWTPDTDVKAVVQVAHGMTEHIGRYENFAKALTENGIAVAGFDLRGHGENGVNVGCASFGENGWEASINDIHLFYETIKQRFECPHYMLGFSLGSFLLREYLGKFNDDIVGAIIMGTGCQPGFVLSIMMSIVKSQIKKAGFNNTTPLVKKLSFETYNKKFRPNRTSADWLCADNDELDLYIDDLLCKEDISSGLFWQLLGSMKRTGEKSAYNNWNKDMPVLLLSGDNDPVGDFGKGVVKVKNAMSMAGVKAVEMHLFKGARHDLLHEKNNGCADKAIEIITKWIL